MKSSMVNAYLIDRKGIKSLSIYIRVYIYANEIKKF